MKMAATNFKTENNTLRKLIGNGLTYRIPRFQRDYSWTDEEWDDLWQDLLSVFDRSNNDDAHYMGYLVLQSNDDKVFYVIDGQQRLTTLSIIVLAGLKNLKKLISDKVEAERNKQRLDQLMGTYIGYLDPVTDGRYFGANLGDKGSGINVKYASDPYWGEKAAAV